YSSSPVSKSVPSGAADGRPRPKVAGISSWNARPSAFASGSLAPVLDGRPPLGRINSPREHLQGVSEGNGPPSSRGNQFTPRSAAAVGSSELRLRPTLWPNLELEPKDVEAMNWWYSSVEAPLAQALPDARCPYPWLPDTHPPDSHEVLAHLSEPYVFEDWKKTWNHPDDSGFEKWLEAMAEKGLEGQRDFTPRLKAHAYAETPGSSRGLRATAADGSEHGVSPEGLDPPASLSSWQAQRCSASSSSIGLKPPRGDRSDG
ncbi:unnamed protein product, partial [Polarella glacialis]